MRISNTTPSSQPRECHLQLLNPMNMETIYEHCTLFTPDVAVKMYRQTDRQMERPQQYVPSHLICRLRNLSCLHFIIKVFSKFTHIRIKRRNCLLALDELKYTKRSAHNRTSGKYKLYEYVLKIVLNALVVSHHLYISNEFAFCSNISWKQCMKCVLHIDHYHEVRYFQNVLSGQQFHTNINLQIIVLMKNKQLKVLYRPFLLA